MRSSTGYNSSRVIAVMNPSDPRVTPRIGFPEPPTTRAAERSVPSPPMTIKKSHLSGRFERGTASPCCTSAAVSLSSTTRLPRASIHSPRSETIFFARGSVCLAMMPTHFMVNQDNLSEGKGKEPFSSRAAEGPWLAGPPPAAVSPMARPIAMVPATGDPRRCGGGDEAACGARKELRRAEPAASGRKVASVAEGTPPRARGPGTGRTMTGAPCAEYARTFGNPSPPLEPRVGGVLDPLAQEVVPEDGDQDGQTGIDGEPP